MQTTFGFKFIPDTASSSGPVIVGWEFPNVPPVPDENVPPNKATDTHEGPRQQLDAQQMMTQFFSTGKIVNTCQGTCHGKMPGSGQVRHEALGFRARTGVSYSFRLGRSRIVDHCHA